MAVMAKTPRPGQVKTRLVPPLTAAEATALNAAFLRDITARCFQDPLDDTKMTLR